MLASDGMWVFEPSYHGSPLGQKMGEPSAYVPGEDENLISEPLSQIPNLGVKIFRTFG
jgi:hypothetical protein